MGNFSWRYIIIRSKDGVGRKYVYCIHEGYDFKRGVPTSWTEDAVSPMGETFDELCTDLQMMIDDIHVGVFEVKGKKLVMVKQTTKEKKNA